MNREQNPLRIVGIILWCAAILVLIGQLTALEGMELNYLFDFIIMFVIWIAPIIIFVKIIKTSFNNIGGKFAAIAWGVLAIVCYGSTAPTRIFSSILVLYHSYMLITTGKFFATSKKKN